METVGFIGLGRMGSAMAGNIRRAGYPMVVHDVVEGATRALLEEGANPARSPAEVASHSDIIFTSLPGPKEVEAVALGAAGILEGIKDGAIYVDLSTCGPSLIRRLQPIFRQKGAEVLDSPVMSSPTMALSRQLVAMVGGELEVFERVQPILDVFSDQVMYVGSLGTGCVIKLVTNMMTLSVGQIVAEGLTLGVKGGAALQDILEVGSREEVGGILGRRKATLGRTWFRGQFEDLLFTLALARKDLGEATNLSRECDVPMPMVSVMEQIFMDAMNRGWADKASGIYALLQEQRAGVEVRLPEASQ